MKKLILTTIAFCFIVLSACSSKASAPITTEVEKIQPGVPIEPPRLAVGETGKSIGVVGEGTSDINADARIVIKNGE